jgi:hypothetical protein
MEKNTRQIHSRIGFSFSGGVQLVLTTCKRLIIAPEILLFLFVALPVISSAQEKNAAPADKSATPSKFVKLTIVVTGGEEKKPVDSASVYVKFIEERKIFKDKHIEMNLKTNLSGVTHAPEIPAGKILIQIIAPGWKTFGSYFQVDQAEQTINISLDHPPKWY